MLGFLRCSRGVSAVELALLMPAVLLVLLGVIDVGMAWEARMRMEEAVASGAQYALRNGTGTAAADVVKVVQNTAGLDGVEDAGTAYSATSCYCYPTDWDDASQSFVKVTQTVADQETGCTATCSNGAAGRYVVVKARYRHTPILASTPWLTDMTIDGFTLLRID